MAGNDLRHMAAETQKILTNKEVIAIDQDALGQQGYRASINNDLEVFVKPLQGGDTAVCLFNRGDGEKKVDLSWASIQIGAAHKIRDVWKGEAVSGGTGVNFRGTLARHGVVLLKLTN